MTDFFIYVLHAIHFSSVTFNETIISIPMNANFPLLSVSSVNMFHMVKIGR